MRHYGKLEVARIERVINPNIKHPHLGTLISDPEVTCLIKNVPENEKEVVVRICRPTNKDKNWFYAAFISPFSPDRHGSELLTRGIPTEKFLLYGTWEDFMKKDGKAPMHEELHRHFDLGAWCYFFIGSESTNGNGRVLVTPERVIDFKGSIADAVDFDIWGAGDEVFDLEAISEQQISNNRIYPGDGVAKYKSTRTFIFEREPSYGTDVVIGEMEDAATRKGILPVKMEPIRTPEPVPTYRRR